jgi:hypothetical protein
VRVLNRCPSRENNPTCSVVIRHRRIYDDTNPLTGDHNEEKDHDSEYTQALRQ